MQLATKTLEAIDRCLEEDGGARFRVLQKEAFSELTDAFSPKEESFRSHLGASVIGRLCARDVWYSFHWAKKPTFPAATLRLFNRGHLEEARFTALLRMIGCTLHTHDGDGKQLRIRYGHFGGSLDGVVERLPDLPSTPVLAEFKTHNSKSFSSLVSEGVKKAKWEHYVQMNVYAHSYLLTHCFYFAVNKDNDQLHAEIFPTDTETAERYLQRAQSVIESPEPPMRINTSPGWYQCRYCNHHPLCHDFSYPEINCRTCTHSTPQAEGGWVCELGKTIDKQCTACHKHVFNPTMLNGIEVISVADGNMVYRRPDKKIVDTSKTPSQDLV